MNLLEILFFMLVLSFAGAALSIAPWVPTQKKDLQRIHQLAQLKAGQVFFEMGCGDSRVSRYIAKNNPQAKVIWIDMCIPMYLYAKVLQWLFPIQNLTILFGDGFYQDLKKVDIAYVFGVPESMNMLQKKFEKDLKKWAKVFSYVCEMKNWKGIIEKNKPQKEVLAIFIHHVD